MLGPPERELATPFVTMISPNAKPVTSSLNVAVTVNGETFVGSVAVVDKTTDGDVESYVLLSVTAAVFPPPTISNATLAGISTETSP